MVWVQGYELYGLLIEQVACALSLSLSPPRYSGFKGTVNPPYRFLAISGPCNTLTIHEVTLVFISVLFFSALFYT